MGCIGKINFLAENGEFQTIELELPVSDSKEVTEELIFSELLKNEDKFKLYNETKTKGIVEKPAKLSVLDSMDGTHVAGNIDINTITTHLNDMLGPLSKLNLINTLDNDANILLVNSRTSRVETALLKSKDGKNSYLISDKYQNLINLVNSINLKEKIKTKDGSDIFTAMKNDVTNILKVSEKLDNIKSRRVKRILKDINGDVESFIDYMLFDSTFNHEIALNFNKEYNNFKQIILKNTSELKTESLKIKVDNTKFKDPNINEKIEDAFSYSNRGFKVNLSKLNKIELFDKYDFSKDGDVYEAVNLLNNLNLKINDFLFNFEIDYRTKNNVILKADNSELNTKDLSKMVVNSNIAKNGIRPVEEINGKYIYDLGESFAVTDRLYFDIDNVSNLNVHENYNNAVSEIVNQNRNTTTDLYSDKVKIYEAISKLDGPINKDSKIVIKSDNLNVNDIIMAIPEGIDISKISYRYLLEKATLSNINDVVKSISALNDGSQFNISSLINKSDLEFGLLKFSSEFNSNSSRSDLADSIEYAVDKIKIPFKVVNKSNSVVELQPIMAGSEIANPVYTKKYNNIRRISTYIAGMVNSKTGVTTTILDAEQLNIYSDNSKNKHLPVQVINKMNIINSDTLKRDSKVSDLLPLILNQSLERSELVDLVKSVDPDGKGYDSFARTKYDNIKNYDSFIMFLSEKLSDYSAYNTINPKIQDKLAKHITNILSLNKPFRINEIINMRIDNLLESKNSSMLSDNNFMKVFDSDISYYNPKLSQKAMDFLDVYGIKLC